MNLFVLASHQEIQEMAKYKRCPEAKDDACGKVQKIKKGGIVDPTNPEYNYATCPQQKGCKKTDDTDCKCFVVALHVKVNDDGSEEITEEVTYPASGKPEPDGGLLNYKKIEDDYPKKGKGHEKDYWNIACICLAVKDGEPIKA